MTNDNHKGVLGSSAQTYWATETGYQSIDPLTEPGFLFKMLHSAWDTSAQLESERDRLKEERDRWCKVATAYRIGMAAEGYRLYHEIVDENR